MKPTAATIAILFAFAGCSRSEPPAANIDSSPEKKGYSSLVELEAKAKAAKEVGLAFGRKLGADAAWANRLRLNAMAPGPFSIDIEDAMAAVKGPVLIEARIVDAFFNDRGAVLLVTDPRMGDNLCFELSCDREQTRKLVSAFHKAQSDFGYSCVFVVAKLGASIKRYGKKYSAATTNSGTEYAGAEIFFDGIAPQFVISGECVDALHVVGYDPKEHDDPWSQ